MRNYKDVDKVVHMWLSIFLFLFYVYEYTKLFTTCTFTYPLPNNAVPVDFFVVLASIYTLIKKKN